MAFLCLMLISCSSTAQKKEDHTGLDEPVSKQLRTGAERTELYLDKLKGKKVALVANQTSVVRNNVGNSREVSGQSTSGSASAYVHLVDTLLGQGVELVKVFAPEHGFRGKQDAGEKVLDHKDEKTGLPIVSLYGKNKKPSAEQLAGVDLVVFDIQDVGVRFYTYISTLHYVMEACAEQNIPLLLLDRPNPNGHYLDGPILEPEFKSFVGMHPVPIVYGMTIGEYGQMINGEAWLNDGIQCSLEVVPLESYKHAQAYSLPILPSPNLPNDQSINLYPSLCFFEGTPISCGRGTDMQFQIFGGPDLPEAKFSFQFVPEPNAGAKYPKHEGKTCYGMDLRKHPRLANIELDWLIQAYEASENKEKFFIPFFDKLAGTAELKEQIKAGKSAQDIKESWQGPLNDFRKTREAYLLYD